MPRPKKINPNYDEQIATLTKEIDDLTAALKAKKAELKTAQKAKAKVDKAAAEKKAEEDQAAILAAVAASGKSLEEVLALLRSEE